MSLALTGANIRNLAASLHVLVLCIIFLRPLQWLQLTFLIESTKHNIVPSIHSLRCVAKSQINCQT